MCIWRSIRDLWELRLWSRDLYSTWLRLVLYGSLDHTPRSHKSHIELQTHIIYYINHLIRAEPIGPGLDTTLENTTSRE